MMKIALRCFLLAPWMFDMIEGNNNLGAAAANRVLQNGFNLEDCPDPGSSVSNFNIQTINMGDPNTDSRYLEAFDLAAQRWQKIIVGDLQGFPANSVDDWFGGVFLQPYNGAVDDVVIGYEVSGLGGGPGGILGRASSVFARVTPRGVAVSAISGIMQFDLDDFRLMSDDDVKVVILHEMGHILGLVGSVGTCASRCDPRSTVNSAYQCDGANSVYQSLTNGQQRLLLENSGGPGTACAHWEEDSFRVSENSELMTGFFEPFLFQPISLVTVAALQDTGGYQVDFCGADVWPATAESIQRFKVFRTGDSINGTIDMEDVPTMMGMDEGGSNLGPIFDMVTSSGSRLTLVLGFSSTMLMWLISVSC